MKYYIGVDLGGTNIAIGLVDENYKIVDKISTPTLASRGADAVINDIINTTKNEKRETNVNFFASRFRAVKDDNPLPQFEKERRKNRIIRVEIPF